MKIILTQTESEDYFLNALCNGLHELGNYGVELDYIEDEYKLSRASLGPNAPCFEDVLMQMLRDGYKLAFTDTEAKDYGTEETIFITMQDVYAKVQETDTRHLLDMINEQDDAVTADVILQTVIYGEVIFG
jgi:UDP-glucose 6-dehydrogenase